MARDRWWTDLPRAVLAEEKSQDTAKLWATNQRTIAAKAWADTLRQDAIDTYAAFTKTQPPDNDWDKLTRGQGAYTQPDQPQAASFSPEAPSPLDTVRDAASSVARTGAQAFLDTGKALSDATRKLPGGDVAVDFLQSGQRERRYREEQTPLEKSLDPPPDPQDAMVEMAMGVSGGGLGKAARKVGAATAKGIAEEAKRLRLDKFPEAVRDTIQEAAESGDFWRTQRRGVITDDVAEKMADDLGRSVDQMIAGGKAGKIYNTEEVRALRNSLTAQAVKVNDLAAQIAEAPQDAGRGLIARSIAEGMKMANLSRIVEGARAEQGRGLGAWRGFTRDYAKDPEAAIERIFKAVGGPEEALKAVTQYQKMVSEGANAAQLASFWARAERKPPTALDWWELNRMTSMLSGPRTMIINALGSAVEVPWKLAGDLTEATVMRRNPGEIVPEVKAIWAGLRRGVDNAMETIAYGITNEAAEAGALPRGIAARVDNPIAKTAATALEAPLRLQQATDEVGMSVAYSMEIARQAAIRATSKGLKGNAWKEAVADGIANPAAGQMKEAKRVADEMTMRGEMGNLGRALAHIQKVPILGPAVLPFLKTVYQITARGVDRSPLGAIGTGIDIARGVYKGGKELPQGVRPLGARARDNALGSAATLWFYDQAAKGNVTGKGPDDPQKRAMLEAQGWMPYSIKLGGEYRGYQNWGAIATPLALAAAAAETQVYAKPSDTLTQKAADMVGRTIGMFAEQTMLQGVGAIYRSATDFERYGHQWLQGYLQSTVPYGAAINTAGQATDPLVRKPERNNLEEGMAARFPVLRESLPAKQDVLGRDVVNEQQGLEAANPIRSREGRPSDVLQVLLENGVDLPSTPPKTRANVTLTRDEQESFQRTAGVFIERAVRRIVADPTFAARPAARKKVILQNAVEDARERAEASLRKSIPNMAERRAATAAAR